MLYVEAINLYSLCFKIVFPSKITSNDILSYFEVVSFMKNREDLLDMLLNIR